MSVIVALKYKGKIYMGSDSMALRSSAIHYLTNENNRRIFKINGISNTLMALDGPVNESNVLSNSSLIKDNKELNFEYIVNNLVRDIFDLFDERNLLIKDEDGIRIYSDIILAHKDHLYEIFNDGSVIESDDFLAIGNGKDSALGSLFTTRFNDNPKERIIMAIKASIRDKSCSKYPIMIIDTETCEFEIIEN